jgi:DNA-binding GntR family transcriptional regulator
VSAESLVTVVLAIWVLLWASVFVPSLLPRRAAELSATQSAPGSLEDFVEAIARGDVEAAEQAAAAVFGSARRGMTAFGAD